MEGRVRWTTLYPAIHNCIMVYLLSFNGFEIKLHCKLNSAVCTLLQFKTRQTTPLANRHNNMGNFHILFCTVEIGILKRDENIWMAFNLMRLYLHTLDGHISKARKAAKKTPRGYIRWDNLMIIWAHTDVWGGWLLK